ncbi:hypothetical protein [Cognatiluteimonas telluris]|uniref:hypothetical protein n=1 Tax=Cognatiluteimonas telluris TaxID=1104775 RepID=UPI001408B73C|nr:hypothetical protein [Lysobacter telluris]
MRRASGAQALALALLVAVAGLSPRPVLAQPLQAVVDARGFIDPWALGAQLRQVDALPSGDEDGCWRGDDADGPQDADPRRAQQRERRIEQRRARCIDAQRRITAARDAALARLSRAWRPALESAATHGDGVAEVVLRLCETAPLLDRTGIAADCSSDAADQAIARRRLEAVGFAPALYHDRAPRTWPDLADSNCARGEAPQDRQCRQRESTQRFAQLQQVMESGAMSVAPRYANCGHPGSDDDVLVDGCERAWMLDQAIAVRARRFYTMASTGAADLSLQRAPAIQPFEYWGTAWPYDTLGRVRHIDNRDIDDRAWEVAFYTDVARALEREEAAIRADLARDPRWAAFLLLRHAPPARRGDERYFGTWRGTISSVEGGSVITVLRERRDGVGIEGSYLLGHRDWGELHPCMKLSADNLLCQWTDHAGHGFVNFHFDFDQGRFKGKWNGPEAWSFPDPGPYGEDDPGGWSGVRD